MGASKTSIDSRHRVRALLHASDRNRGACPQLLDLQGAEVCVCASVGVAVGVARRVERRRDASCELEAYLRRRFVSQYSVLTILRPDVSQVTSDVTSDDATAAAD